MKHPVFCLLLCAGILLTSGVCVAYYNTRSFGFDEDAAILTYDDERITILEYTIQYADLKKLADKAAAFVPEESITIVSAQGI